MSMTVIPGSGGYERLVVKTFDFLCLGLSWRKALPNNILSNMCRKGPVNTKQRDIVDNDQESQDFIIYLIFLLLFSLSFLKGVRRDFLCHSSSHDL